MRVGLGYDVHRTDQERKSFFLGGVEINAEFGLIGHSDADVLIHAIIDALLGALGKGDIGDLFPDTDVQYKNISSVLLLEKVKKMFLDKEDKKIINIDANIIAEEPKISPYKQAIKDRLALVLDVDATLINIKAKTNETLGYLGVGQGIAAQAVVLIQ